MTTAVSLEHVGKTFRVHSELNQSWQKLLLRRRRLLAGDRLSPLHWGGGALILTGSLLPEFGTTPSHESVAEP